MTHIHSVPCQTMSNYVKPWPFGIRRLSSRDIYVLLLFFMILLIPPRSPLLFLPDYVLFRNMWRLEAYCCRARELTIRLSPRRLQRSERTKLRDFTSCWQIWAQGRAWAWAALLPGPGLSNGTWGLGPEAWDLGPEPRPGQSLARDLGRGRDLDQRRARPRTGRAWVCGPGPMPRPWSLDTEPKSHPDRGPDLAGPAKKLAGFSRELTGN